MSQQALRNIKREQSAEWKQESDINQAKHCVRQAGIDPATFRFSSPSNPLAHNYRVLSPAGSGRPPTPSCYLYSRKMAAPCSTARVPFLCYLKNAPCIPKGTNVAIFLPTPLIVTKVLLRQIKLLIA